MGSRGRKSAAELTVIGAGGVESIRRPEPPDELSDEQAEEWRAVVNRLPAEWFPRETLGLLVQYCRHVVRARRLAQLIEAEEASEDFSTKNYRDLLRSEEEQSRAIASLATRMRISQQATVDKRKQKPTQRKKPWEAD